MTSVRFARRARKAAGRKSGIAGRGSDEKHAGDFRGRPEVFPAKTTSRSFEATCRRPATVKSCGGPSISRSSVHRGRMSTARSYAEPAKPRRADGRIDDQRSRRVENPKYRTGDTSSVSTAAGIRRLRWKRSAQARSGSAADHDFRRRPRNARPDSVRRPARYRPSERRRDRRLSAAAGAVGSLAGQIAKIKGCVSSEPRPRTRNALRREDLGFDVCINYKTADLKDAFKAACPNASMSISISWRRCARGRAAEADQRPCAHSADRTDRAVLRSEARPGQTRIDPGQSCADPGTDHLRSHRSHARFSARHVAVAREGKVRYREDIVQGGLENGARAFIGLMQGKTSAKRIVQVAPDPTRKEKR